MKKQTPKRRPHKLRAAKATEAKMLAIRCPVTIQEAAAEEGKAPGPPTFEALAYSGGVLPGYTAGLDMDVIVDLKGLKPIKGMKANLDHNKKQRVGHVTDVANDGKTLKVSGVLSAATQFRDEVVGSAKDGFEWEVSVENDLAMLTPLYAGKTAVVNGQTVKGPLYIARKAQLTGIGFVSHGADEGNSVKIAATAAKKGTDMDFATFVIDQDFDPENLSEKQRTFLEAAHKASQKPATIGDGGILGQRRIESERQKAIRQVANAIYDDYPDEGDKIEQLASAAIESGEAATAFELAILRQMRPVARSRTAAPQEKYDARILEAALCKTLQLPGREDQFEERTLEAADKQFRHGLGLGELLLIAARQNGGYTGLSVSDVRPVLEAAFPPRGVQLRAGFSTVALPGILGNVANKFIVEYFNQVEQEWRKGSAIRSVKNFQEITSHSLTGDFEYKEVGPTGQLMDAQPSETTYNNQAKTYGRRLCVTRPDIVNDDGGALVRVPKLLGRGGALKLNDVFWTEFLANSAFFTTALGNLDEGADTEFSADALTLADTLFRSQTGPDGKPLGAMPKVLWIPPAYRIAALKLMRSQTVAAADEAGTDNPWAGMFTVLSSVYMANSTYTGSSAKKFYLTADPNDLPVIETCFLNGKEMPTVESADADFSQLGIEYRGYHDFGCRKQEYRGGVAMKGEV